MLKYLAGVDESEHLRIKVFEGLPKKIRMPRVDGFSIG
jgi:hypothetical protein